MSDSLSTVGLTQTLPDGAVLSLRDGGVLGRAFAAIQARLRLVFPERPGLGGFVHGVVPPMMSPAVWDRLSKETPFIGLGWVGWPSKGARRAYAGDLHYALFLADRNPLLDRQLTGDAFAPGVFAMVSAALAALQGFRVDGIGSVEIVEASGVWSEDWVRDDQQTAGLRITIPGVQLDDALAAASLDDFKLMAAAWGFADDGSADGLTGTQDFGSGS